jgi:predicted amidohydrolase
LLDEAAAKGATLAVLPEMFTFMGDSAEYADNAEPIPGPVTDRLCEKAEEHGMWVHSGSFFEESAEDDRVYNTTVVVSPQGEIEATYRKIHLFDVEIGDEVVTQESATVVPGDRPKTVDLGFTTAGLTICYDLRFPELFSSLAEAGADLVVLPAAFTKHTGKDHWAPLLRARAIETQSYVVATGQFGDKEDSVPTWGRSLIIDPWGTVVARASDGERVITAEFDEEYLSTIQRELPSLQHKRFDSYDLPS